VPLNVHDARHGRSALHRLSCQVARHQDGEARLARTTSPVLNNDTSVKWFLGCFYLVLAAPAGQPGPGSTLGGVRQTDFWNRMRTQFGDAYAQSVAKDFVFDTLGGRTVDRALADGVDAKIVWRAVCDTFKVPENMR
jgi:hypothetical protein